MTSHKPIDTRVLLGLIGLLLLAVGFAFGYIVGSSSTPKPQPVLQARATQTPPTQPHEHASAHTFDGVDSPPHDEAGHQKATSLLAGQMCPCGGCDDLLADCKCDVAAEIRGVTAHLFTRGQDANVVASQLQQHYGLAVVANTGHDPLDIVEILNQ